MKRECVGTAVCVHVSIQAHRTPKPTPFMGNEAKRDAMFVVIRSHNNSPSLTCSACFLCVPPDLRILRSCKGKLEKDLRDKFGAQNIDNTCAGLTDDRQYLTYNPDAVKIQTK